MFLETIEPIAMVCKASLSWSLFRNRLRPSVSHSISYTLISDCIEKLKSWSRMHLVHKMHFWKLVLDHHQLVSLFVDRHCIAYMRELVVYNVVLFIIIFFPFSSLLSQLPCSVVGTFNETFMSKHHTHTHFPLIASI